MLPDMELNGTSAIISGGASGLGEATARVLAAAGATVVVADLNQDRGKQVADEIGGQFARTDVADEASVQAAVDTAVATGSPLRVAVSCAGIGWAARTVGRDGTPHDLAAIGVRVNTICPGIIDTPIYGSSLNSDEFKARLVAPVVFPKRMGRADEFGHLVRMLIENDYMNAEVVRFDGGIRFQPKL